MGTTTGIGWTDHTANFWMGCQRVSPGCENCYAETLVTGRMKLPVWGPPKTTKRQRAKGVWSEVPRWNAAARREGVRRKVFVSSLADIFEDHPDVAPWRADALALLERCTSLDVQLLTKRPENIMRMVPAHWHTAWPTHVWIGTTVEDQRRAEERIPHMLRVPARVRFLSCEPLLERVDLGPWIGTLDCRSGPDHWRGFEADGCDAGHRDECTEDETACEGENGHCPVCGSAYHVGPIEPREEFRADDWRDVHSSGRTLHPIDWVIVGGESGPGARPFDLAWARSILRQCREAGVPVFVKQLGAVARCEPADLVGRVVGREVELIERGYETRWELILRDRAGATVWEWPADLRVQQFPGGAL